jgi:hypothetical protein
MHHRLRQLSHAILQGDPQWVTRRLPALMLPAFAGCVLCARYDIPGLLSCFQLAAFAVSAAMLADFQIEKGLWVLAGLFFVFWVGISLTWLVGETRDWVRGVAPPATLMADAAMATAIMHGHTRFLWKTVLRNWAFSRE